MEKDLEEFCIVWFESKMWIQDLRPTIDFLQTARRNPFVLEGKFDHVADVVQEVGHRFGGFQNAECQVLKEKLVDMEYEGSGRVPLSKFYSGINDDRDWPFLESAEYLRNLGALDDTNPSRPAVIIPNFLSSPSNCVAPSSFYSVCCMDECEGLLSQVEQAVASPAASVARLEEVAGHHGDGRVPLHGRLFAQWLHHA